jgi:hypothetical protein
MTGVRIGDSMLRHPSNPLEMEWPDGQEIYPLAFQYVRKFAHHLRFKKELLGGLAQPPLAGWTAAAGTPSTKSLVLRWFALEASDAPNRDPRNSFFFADRAADQSGVLFAGACLKNGTQKKVYFSHPRIRVVFHVAWRMKTRYVRFTGLSMTAGDTMPLEPTPPVPAPPPIAPSPEGPEVFGDVFPLDPASVAGAQRPEDLDDVGPDQPSSAFKKAQKRKSLGNLPQGKAGRVVLAGEYVHIFKSSLVDADQEGWPKEVAVQKADGGLEAIEKEARTKDFAAISAYYHGRSLFERLNDYGIHANRYFRCAELPVGIEYRADFQRGSGGNFRNADVRWAAPPDYDRRGRILMRFGIADDNLDSPLSLACDVRWFWHELGHVLLMAAVGEREFRFCHSPGDAFAAVLCDPRSRLSRHEHWGGVTIPWAQLRPDRRHDRSAREGWAWGGSLDRNEEGYWQEQILSSSMFRLYKALGGDRQTEEERVAAAEYTAYLLVRAIGLLGPAAIVPAETVDHLVSALMDADIGTSEFTFAASKPRVGGTAYKVVRSAFEQQGMAGEPVDVSISEFRLSAATVVHKTSKVHLKVTNRGSTTAKNVQITIWAVPATAGVLRRPAEDHVVYERKKVQLPAGKSITSQFGWKPVLPGKRLLFAEVTCGDDRSIIDPETRLPCALGGAPLDQLLNGDNNLGAVEVDVKAK